MDLGPSCFQDALQLVKGFHNLDILTIGSDDNNYVIHRELLLQDIHEYISDNPKGPRRLFVDVNHHLAKPEIMPGNRCPLLEEYVEEILKPEIECRVISWQREGFSRNCVPAPSGDDDNDDDDEEDENACDRNCLADRDLVVTNMQLEPSKGVVGLRDHCLMSFSYPAHLAEFCKDSTTQTTESPCKSSGRARGGIVGDDDDDDDDNDVFVDASDVEYQTRSGSINAPILKKPLEPDCDPGSILSNGNNSSVYPSDPYETHHHQPQPQSNGGANGRSLSEDSHSLLVQEQLSALKAKQQLQNVMERAPKPVSEFCGRVRSELPMPNNEDVFTAGRSFLQQMHNRFQDQRVFKDWEVGQQTVSLPMVGLR
ncbi:hypothetical protein BGX26_001947 [Mortierella sp. AD094]|nr:hypothetical protein BGX26_001947 [Mortierella sp. AD094]